MFIPRWLVWGIVVSGLLGCGEEPTCESGFGFPVIDETGKVDCGEVDISIAALLDHLGYGRKAVADIVEASFYPSIDRLLDHCPPNSFACYDPDELRMWLAMPSWMDCTADTGLIHEVYHHILTVKTDDPDGDHTRPLWDEMWTLKEKAAVLEGCVR